MASGGATELLLGVVIGGGALYAWNRGLLKGLLGGNSYPDITAEQIHEAQAMVATTANVDASKVSVDSVIDPAGSYSCAANTGVTAVAVVRCTVAGTTYDVAFDKNKNKTICVPTSGSAPTGAASGSPARGAGPSGGFSATGA